MIGDRTVIGPGALIHPGVRIWPGKEVESGAIVSRSIIWGSHGRRALFGRYGVTGIVNVDMTPDSVARLGAAFGSVLPKGSTVVVNRDSHRSSRMIKRALISGLPSAGNNVLDVRTLPIPVARYHIRAARASGGVHVRVSPFDPRVIDIRFFGSDGWNLTREQERAIERIYFREDFRRGYMDDIGNIEYALDAGEVYARGYLEAIDAKVIRNAGLRIVVDYAHSPAADVLADILDDLNVEVVPLNARSDPNKISLSPEDFRAGLRQLSRITGALQGINLGVRLDVGGERIFVVDDVGTNIPGPMMAAAMASLVFQTRPGSRVAITTDQARVFERLAQRYRGSVLRCPVDLQALARMSAGVHADLAADSVGNFIFPDLHPVNDGLLAVGKLLELLARQRRVFPMWSPACRPFSCHRAMCPDSGRRKAVSWVVSCSSSASSNMRPLTALRSVSTQMNGCSSAPMKRPRRFTSLRRPAPSRMRSNSSPTMAGSSRRLSRSRVPIHRSRKASIASFPACPMRVSTRANILRQRQIQQQPISRKHDDLFCPPTYQRGALHMNIEFGTDGWRAVISDQFTFDNVRHVAQAIAEMLLEKHTTTAAEATATPLAVVGFDTRFLSDRYAWAVSEVLAANGIRVALAKADAPTPVISYAIPLLGAIGGVMITASHNPPRYNGIKLKADYGGSATPADTKLVEAHLAKNLATGKEPQRMELERALVEGRIARFDPFPAYRSIFTPWWISTPSAKRTCALPWTPCTGRARLSARPADRGRRGSDRNSRGDEPWFQRHSPGADRQTPRPADRTSHLGGYDLGLAMDGDADRIGRGGADRRFIDPHASWP